jgi:hypothetical protein
MVIAGGIVWFVLASLLALTSAPQKHAHTGLLCRMHDSVDAVKATWKIIDHCMLPYTGPPEQGLKLLGLLLAGSNHQHI